MPGYPALLLAVGYWHLADPYWLLAWLVIPGAVWLRNRARVAVWLVPFAAAWHRPSLLGASRWPAVLTLTGLVLLVGGLARPQVVEDKHETHTKGYDIMLCIDLSGSMLSEDYVKDGHALNRLAAIKPVIRAFIENRPQDRIGIVLFSGHAYTMAPLTTDHEWLDKQLERVYIGLIEDGTAIGDGIGVALTRLDQASRDNSGRRLGAFIVLLTDGANNRGALQPMQAAAIAKARGVPVYTIGAGKDGFVPFPVFDDKGNRIDTRMIPADLDETALRQIADTTGGHFYRAADTDTIESAFRSIDRAQKIEFQAKSYLLTTEEFPWLVGPGAAFLLLGMLLARGGGRRVTGGSTWTGGKVAA